jgi:hypothetical protein
MWLETDPDVETRANCGLAPEFRNSAHQLSGEHNE